MVSHFEGRRIFAVYASLSICTRFFICALQFRINEKKKRKFMYIRSMKISRDWKTWSSINCIINTYWQYWLDIDHFLLRIEQQYFLYEIRNHDSYYCSSLLFLWFLLSFILFFLEWIFEHHSESINIRPSEDIFKYCLWNVLIQQWYIHMNKR